MHYFAHSPFHDPTSNNATLTTQANYNPSLLKYVETREAFEGQLRTMSGLEFIVAFEPPQAGAWVIRKQNRRKRHGSDDDITVLSTFFVIGETIYTAPTVGDVIGSRLVRKSIPIALFQPLTPSPALDCHLLDQISIDHLESARFLSFEGIYISKSSFEDLGLTDGLSALADEQGADAHARCPGPTRQAGQSWASSD